MPITVQSYEEEFTIHNPVSKIREKESGKAILREEGAKHGDAGRGRIGAERRTEREQRGQGADEAGGRERRGDKGRMKRTEGKEEGLPSGGQGLPAVNGKKF